MPVFKLNKALGVGRDKKVFVDLRCGLARGDEPDRDGLLEARERRIGEQEARLREKEQEITHLKEELTAANGRTGALPDFLVIGAPRCGTSQFYRALLRHPLVFGASEKEVHYFDVPGRFGRGLGWYRQCFPAPRMVDGRRSITGEATPRYLADPLVPGRVARVVPDARFIALLRNPVDRALSHYHLRVRRGKTESFEELVEAEMEWLARHDLDHTPGPSTNLITTGLYVDHLRRWQRLFGRDRVLVLNSDDFFKRTAETVDEVQDFLGLPRRELDLAFLGSKRGTKYHYGPMAPATRERLEAFFGPHNGRLYDHLGRDLGW